MHLKEKVVKMTIQTLFLSLKYEYEAGEIKAKSNIMNK